MEQDFVKLENVRNHFNKKEHKVVSQVAIRDDGTAWLEVLQDGNKIFTKQITMGQLLVAPSLENKFRVVVAKCLIDAQ